MSKYTDKTDVTGGLIHDINGYIREFEKEDESTKAKYKDKPLEYLKDVHDITFPPKLESILLTVLEKVRNNEEVNAIYTAPRSGGKSMLASVIEFMLWHFYDCDFVNMGGSEVQAQEVYKYIDQYIENDIELRDTIGANGGKRNMSETTKTSATTSAYLHCVTASTKQVRGPHPGGYRNSPGGLIIDEAVEVPNGLVDQAIPMLGAANPAVMIMLSTFHALMNDFARYWDDADDPENEFIKASWDCFDVCQQCADNCDDCIPEFAKIYCKGKARDTERGWMKLKFIKQRFRTMDRASFETDMMGMRPSIAGLVLSPESVENAFSRVTTYNPKLATAMGIDWGLRGATAIVVGQQYPVLPGSSDKYGRREIIDVKVFTELGDLQLYDEIRQLRDKYKCWTVRADNSHPFQNKHLEDELKMNVTEINFGVDKEMGVGVMRKFFEDGLIIISSGMSTTGVFKTQLKKWHRNPNTGKIVKSDDHTCDALLCYLHDASQQATVYSSADDWTKREVMEKYFMKKHRDPEAILSSMGYDKF